MRRLVFAAMLALCACGPAQLVDRATVATYTYTLGPGDRLKVATYGEQRLTGEFVVNSQGNVSFPLLGDVAASGMTLGDFQTGLVTRLGSELLRNPQVSVEMVNFRPVYVLGEVARPGEFAYVERLSVFALVAKAGGFSYRANRSFAYIRGENDSDERAVRLSSATAVQPGDTIRIPERTF